MRSVWYQIRLDRPRNIIDCCNKGQGGDLIADQSGAERSRAGTYEVTAGLRTELNGRDKRIQSRRAIWSMLLHFRRDASKAAAIAVMEILWPVNELSKQRRWFFDRGIINQIRGYWNLEIFVEVSSLDGIASQMKHLQYFALQYVDEILYLLIQIYLLRFV